MSNDYLNDEFNNLELNNISDINTLIKVITSFTKATALQNQLLTKNAASTEDLCSYFKNVDGFRKDLKEAINESNEKIIKDVSKNNRIFFLSITGILTVISTIVTLIFTFGNFTN